MHIDFKYNSNYIWRIFFTLMIATIHSGRIPTTSSWYIGVDYFFILSGVLLCHTTYKKNEKTSKYVLRRILKLYPHVLFSFLMLALFYRASFELVLSHITEALPFTYFWQSKDFWGGYAWNFPVWYLSVLLICSLIIHYLLMHYRTFFIELLAPIIIVMNMTYLWNNAITLNTGNTINIFLNEYIIRGMLEMCIGVEIYVLVKYIEKYVFRKAFEIIRDIGEILCLVGVVIYSFNHNGRIEFLLLIFLAIGVFLSFCHCINKLSQSWLLKYVNDLTYPIYLNHIFVLKCLTAAGFLVNENNFIFFTVYFSVLIIY